MKTKVMWMNGGRFDGYYYVGIEGTDLRVCKDGHPDFPCFFYESEKGAEKKAQKLVQKINKQLKELNI